MPRIDQERLGKKQGSIDYIFRSIFVVGFAKGHTGGCMNVTYDGCDAGKVRILLIRPGNDWTNNPCPCLLTAVEDCPDHTESVWDCPEENVRCIVSLAKNDNVSDGEIRVEGRGHIIVRLVWELPCEEDIFPFIPAFMYGDNKGGDSPDAIYPRLARGPAGFNRPWESDRWLVRADRSSHCVTSAAGSRMTYTVGGSDISVFAGRDAAGKNGLGVSAADTIRLVFSMGYINHPYTYSTVAGRNCFSTPEGYISLDSGTVRSRLFIILNESQGLTADLEAIVRKSYGLIHTTRFNEKLDIYAAMTDIAGSLTEYSFCPEADNFLVGWFPNERINKKNMMFNTAWAGGLRAAYPLLAAGRLLGIGHFVECAAKVFDNISNNALSGYSGLLYENYDICRQEWNTRGWWYEMLEKPGHSAYINGQAAYYLLLAWKRELKAGTDHPKWKDTAIRIIDKVLTKQDDTGCFGCTFREDDGEVLDRDGFCGCWFIPPLALLYEVTGDKAYLAAAERAMDHYRAYVERYEVYGCPHDTFKSPDEEGILAWAEASRIMHEITGKDKYLTDLTNGLGYEFSWKFGYDVYNMTEPLKTMRWSSTGGSVTSVNNAHIHPMGCSILYDILYAWRMTKDDYYLSRLNDTLDWGLHSYIRYDGHYGWGHKGMINERFCYTDSLLTERYSDGTPSAVWFCYHSWAAGAVLEGLTTIMEKVDDEEKSSLYCTMEGPDR